MAQAERGAGRRSRSGRRRRLGFGAFSSDGEDGSSCGGRAGGFGAGCSLPAGIAGVERGARSAGGSASRSGEGRRLRGGVAAGVICGRAGRLNDLRAGAIRRGLAAGRRPERNASPDRCLVFTGGARLVGRAAEVVVGSFARAGPGVPSQPGMINEPVMRGKRTQSRDDCIIDHHRSIKTRPHRAASPDTRKTNGVTVVARLLDPTVRPRLAKLQARLLHFLEGPAEPAAERSAARAHARLLMIGQAVSAGGAGAWQPAGEPGHR